MGDPKGLDCASGGTITHFLATKGVSGGGNVSCDKLHSGGGLSLDCAPAP